MNIFFSLPEKTLHYQVEVRTHNGNTPENIVTYDEYMLLKKETFKGFAVDIKRTNMLLNGSKIQESVNGILFLAAKILEDIELEISKKGEILKVRNQKRIQEYWKEIRFKIKSRYIGDIVDKIIEPMERTIMDERALVETLDKDPFFHYYFGEIFGTYPENQFCMNRFFMNFLFNEPLNIQSKGKIIVHDNGEKQLFATQYIDSGDLTLMQTKMKQQRGDSLLDVKMNSSYLISSERYIKTIEIDQKMNWNEQLIKSVNINVKLVSL